MKTKEAPEKIYLTPLECMAASCQPQKDNTIEYTRTDAFIEKAAKWLNTFYNKETYSYLIAEDIEKFINYMKGE